MIVVFGSFIFTARPVTKELGFALAVVILIDAVLWLLGNHAWAWPCRPAPTPGSREPAARS